MKLEACSGIGDMPQLMPVASSPTSGQRSAVGRLGSFLSEYMRRP